MSDDVRVGVVQYVINYTYLRNRKPALYTLSDKSPRCIGQ